MYFVREFGAGLDTHRFDPRDKVFAEFHCSLCGEDTDINITRVRETFQFDRERKCPHCGQTNAGDKELNLKAQLEKLTSDKSRLEVEIEMIENELNQVTSATKKEIDND